MVESVTWHILLGNLSWNALPFVRAWRDPSVSDSIGAGAGAMVVVGAVAAAAFITYMRAWRTLWTEWLTSLDHKRIGIMYIALAGVMLTRALIEDGERWSVLDQPIDFAGPVRILQGGADVDVPARHAQLLVTAITSPDLVFTLIKDGDHRLSRPQDLTRLIAAVEEVG